METGVQYQEKTGIEEYPGGIPEKNSGTIKDRIQDYWSERSRNFAALRKQELHCSMAERWRNEIEKYIPANKRLKVLDVGTGSGFFAILLAEMGHETTGIDLTPSMIEEASKLAACQNVEADFFVMDAEKPEFADESFDLVISRNLTWTLPHAGEAYGQWNRVLKKGGILLNFDADYGKEEFSDTRSLPEHHIHNRIGKQMTEECDAIKNELDISHYRRPAWDIDVLIGLGMEEIQIDAGISKRIYLEEDDLYNPVPMFAICARKM